MKHIVLAGGGTAGHVNPLLSVADAIRGIEPDANVTVIGSAPAGAPPTAVMFAV